jgi:hypothetical protein
VTVPGTIRLALVVGLFLGLVLGILSGMGLQQHFDGKHEPIKYDVKGVRVGPCMMYAVTITHKGTVWTQHCPDRPGVRIVPPLNKPEGPIS